MADTMDSMAATAATPRVGETAARAGMAVAGTAGATKRATLVLVALALLAGSAMRSAPPGDLLVYFGTYTGGASKGIYVSRLYLTTGTLTAPQLAAETPSPSFLAIRSQGDFLYAVNEVNTFDGKPGGSVSAFAIAKDTGKLTPLNQQGSGGTGPAHLSLDAVGRSVLVANYGGGSVEVLPVGADGRLGAPTAFVQHTGSSVNPDRQREPHAHQIVVDPSNTFAYVADLGLDKVMIYRFDAAKHSLVAASPAFAPLEPGAGPRHVAISASGRFAYVINELNCTVTAFQRDPSNGSLTAFQTVSTLPPGQAMQRGFSTAEIQLHPTGAFLYGSNRGHNSLTVFAVDTTSGRLTYVANTPTQGKTPRGFGIEPGGAYLLAGNQESDSVVSFAIDRATGTLTPGATITVGHPVDVKFVADSR
jgi:6-phosphogluconolactonase